MMKRIFDFVFSFFGIIFLLPIFLIIAILIKLDSVGPVFYLGTRVRKDGKLFKIFKFRTMVVNADKIGGPSTPTDDKRITKIGRVLRKHALDELPQLFNILKGEMSFVGPRPEVQEYVKLFSQEERTILSVKPGLTDYASIRFIDEGAILAGKKDPERTYLEEIRPEKTRLQLKYVKNNSFWGDIKIIRATIKKIF